MSSLEETRKNVQILFDSVFGDPIVEDTNRSMDYRFFEREFRLALLVNRWASLYRQKHTQKKNRDSDARVLVEDDEVTRLIEDEGEDENSEKVVAAMKRRTFLNNVEKNSTIFEDSAFGFVEQLLSASPEFMLDGNHITLINVIKFNVPLCLLLIDEMDTFKKIFDNPVRDFDFPLHHIFKESIFVAGLKGKPLLFSDVQKKRLLRVVFNTVIFPALEKQCIKIGLMTREKGGELFYFSFIAKNAIFTSVLSVIKRVREKFTFSEDVCHKLEDTLERMSIKFLTALNRDLPHWLEKNVSFKSV